MGLAILCLAFVVFNNFRASSEQAAHDEVMEELSTDLDRLRTDLAALSEQLEARRAASEPVVATPEAVEPAHADDN